MHECFVSLLRYAVVQLPTCAHFTKFHKACEYQAPSVRAQTHLQACKVSVCAHVGVCSGSHCTHCDVCAGPGRCHLQAVWPGHGCQGSSAPAHPPAGSTCPVWTPILSGHGVLLQPHSLCILQSSSDEQLIALPCLLVCTFFVLLFIILCTQTCQGMQRGACHIDCTPLGDRPSLLYGLLNQGEAYLIPTWQMREQRLAQV